MQKKAFTQCFDFIPIPSIYKIKIDYDRKKRAVGFHYCDLNFAIESLAGGQVEEQPVKKGLMELFSEGHWLEVFDKVVKTAEPVHLKDALILYGCWYDVYAWKIAESQAAIVFTDVTQRKKAEEALRRQAELIDLSPDGIVVKTLEGVIMFWSLGAEKMYGWTNKEAVGKKIQQLLKTKYPEPMENIINQLKSCGNWFGELTQKTREGHLVFVQSSWLARLNSDNELEILESNVNITERKKFKMNRK